VVEALKRAGPDLTRQKFLDAMVTLKDFPTDTYGAGITCTKQENRCNKAPVWIQKEVGGPVKIVDITKGRVVATRRTLFRHWPEDCCRAAVI